MQQSRRGKLGKAGGALRSTLRSAVKERCEENLI